MTIPLPITIKDERPLTPPESPYHQCGHCQYVGTDIHIGQTCPACGNQVSGYASWPDRELLELWRDEVAMWNEQRVELAHVVDAMYFEASVFHLMFWGTVWLDPELNWIGVPFNETKDKEDRIWKYLYNIRSRKATNLALKRLYHVSWHEMLVRVLGNKEAESFYKNYLRLAKVRNQIVHRGKRIDDNAGQLLNWCLIFVPKCWVVFSRLHNEYIHKPMLRCKQQEGDRC